MYMVCPTQRDNTTALRQKNTELTSENDSLNREVSLLHSDITTLQQKKSEEAKVYMEMCMCVYVLYCTAEDATLLQNQCILNS